MIYLDHNASCPLHPIARDAWIDCNDQFFGNPSSPHRAGSRADAALESARQTMADVLDCDPLDIVWTSGATEANNMVLHHLFRQHPADGEVWVSAIEHPCVLEATRRHFPTRHREIPATRTGVLDLNWVDDQLKSTRPIAVAVIAANNETGVLQPWQSILSHCRERNIPLLLDAAQWMGKLPGQGLGAADFVTGCAHKFGGPKGIGFLKCPPEGRFHPLIHGGPQAEGRRGGTENVPSAVAMAKLLAAREDQMKAGELETKQAVRVRFETSILESLPDCEIIGQQADRLWNTVSLRLPDTDCRARWVVKLDKAGIAVSTGSACSSGNEAPSHVLTALGYSPAQISNVIRISSGWETPEAHWTSLTQACQSIHEQLTAATPTRP